MFTCIIEYPSASNSDGMGYKGLKNMLLNINNLKQSQYWHTKEHGTSEHN